MLKGEDIARLTIAITMGRRMALAMNKSSFINASPWALVEVKVRAPTAEVPIQTDMAECSDSTGINSASTCPSATSSDKCSTIWVCGVIG